MLQWVSEAAGDHPVEEVRASSGLSEAGARQDAVWALRAGGEVAGE